MPRNCTLVMFVCVIFPVHVGIQPAQLLCDMQFPLPPHFLSLKLFPYGSCSFSDIINVNSNHIVKVNV